MVRDGGARAVEHDYYCLLCIMCFICCYYYFASYNLCINDDYDAFVITLCSDYHD
jgi:hypothetical protein